MAGHVSYLNDDTFEEGIAHGVVLVDFFADWCGPCKMMAPVIDELAAEMEGKATIAKVDIESSQKVTSNFNVTSIPTLVIFKDGQEQDRVVGVKDKESLVAMINKLL